MRRDALALFFCSSIRPFFFFINRRAADVTLFDASPACIIDKSRTQWTRHVLCEPFFRCTRDTRNSWFLSLKGTTIFRARIKDGSMGGRVLSTYSTRSTFSSRIFYTLVEAIYKYFSREFLTGRRLSRDRIRALFSRCILASCVEAVRVNSRWFNVIIL